MSRIINGVLTVDSFSPTANPGEYTFTNAAFNNQADMDGSGTSVIVPGFILIVPAYSLGTDSIIPGTAHRYKLTSVTEVDSSHISGTMLWDEVGPELDTPTQGCNVLISAASDNYQFALPASDAVYSGLVPGMTLASQVIDIQQKVDTVGTDWNVISNHPTSVSGYGITDELVYTADTRLTDSRNPLAHSQDWSTILNTPKTLSAFGITDGVTTSDSRLTDARAPLAHTQDWSTITGAPTTFTATAHTHPWTDVTDTPTSISGYGILDTLTNTVNGKSGSVVLKTVDIAEDTNLYYTPDRFNTALSAKTTSDLSEGTRLYFTPARHDYTTLLNIPTTFVPSAHDQAWSTITGTPTTLSGYRITDAVNSSLLGVNSGVATLDAGGKLLTSQIPSSLMGGMAYQGLWNATTNLPVIPAASAANKGYYYVVQTGGTTSVDGQNDWQPTDWIVSNGTTWSKIDNTDKVSSINGQIGIVTLGTDQIAEGTAKYFTESRVLDTALTGLNTAANGNVTATDSVVLAFGKIENRLEAAVAAQAAPMLIFQATSRYLMVTNSGVEVWAHSSSKAYGNIPWARTGTSLVMSHAGHGHVAGNRVIIRNANVDYLCVVIDSVTTDTYTVTCANSGATSGTAANYSLGFTFAHNATGTGQVSNGTLSAPVNENVQLISMRIRLAANYRAGTEYTLTVPASLVNGAGQDDALGSIYAPLSAVRQDTVDMVATTNTFKLNPSSAGFNVIQWYGLPASATGVQIFLQY